MKFAGEGEQGEVSLTDTHPLLLAADKYQSFSQARRVRARDIKQGDRILVMRGGKAAPVTASLLPLLLFLFLLVIFFLQVVGSSLFSSQVRYVLTVNDRILVDGVVGPTARFPPSLLPAFLPALLASLGSSLPDSSSCDR